MAQYHAIKARYPDCLLFYRMGDFYEMFFEDAEKAAAVLDITLTKRGKNQGEEIPMAGVPFHSYEPYMARLIRAGHKVAICEQIESPEEAKKRGGSKALVERDVVRVVTAGTITEDNLLESRANNYLACAAEAGGQCALAWMDLSTGAFSVQPVQKEKLAAAMESLDASEYVLSEALFSGEVAEALHSARKQTTLQPSASFDTINAQKRLEALFGVGTLESFGTFSRAEISACGALIEYVQRTQIGQIPHIARPSQFVSGAVMEIDPATRRNLELSKTLTGESKGSLLHALDCTKTAPGGRMLASFLSSPLCDPDAINARLDKVGAFLNDRKLRELLRETLRSVPDMERALARLTAGRGGPRDLVAIREGLASADHIRACLLQAPLPPLAELCGALKPSNALADFADLLRNALHDEPPALARDGGFIRPGFSIPLDEIKTLRDDSRKLIAALQARYAAETNIDKLKVSYNNMLGYFIEVPAKRADALLVKKGEANNPFVHRQTMANAVRFTTPELAELESRISSAAERALAIELDLFGDFTDRLKTLSDEICEKASVIAALDVFSALAALAEDNAYARPVVDGSLAFDIREGRHPVVEHALAGNAEKFMPNDCDLGRQNRLWLLTGPNMAGKSTFLRQNALIAVMAQIGSYVPASAAHIGVLDRLFSRVGASDDLARGRSTFMVEMVETAAILNQATDRSLVILDEIGRGTATFDGLSIAWACVEHLHETNRCRTLFATHYHELTSLSARLDRLSCRSLQIREWKGQIIFMHKVVEGAADRSYGIHVGKLAGLPDAVITRAEEVLNLLQTGEQGSALTRLADDLPLFTAARHNGSQEKPESLAPSPIEEKLKDINPDDLTPREALEVLYSLKEAMH